MTELATRPIRIPGHTAETSVEAAVEAIARGEIVVVLDDDDRENEGDFVLAAEHATAEAINFMITHGRGLVCMPMAADMVARLDLPAMVPGADGCAFTVSIDLAKPANTGISADDRARCIRRAIDPASGPSDFTRPGHVFPLRARDGGVLRRAGHTEAAVDLARLAGLAPAGVICEIMNDDGSMARRPDLVRLAARHDLAFITVADLIAYRRAHERLVERVAEATVSTPFGPFTVVAYRSPYEEGEQLAFVQGDVAGRADPPVHVHAECVAGDVFASFVCDCRARLHGALAEISEAGEGVVVYLRGGQGHGIGLPGHGAPRASDESMVSQILADLEVGAGRRLPDSPELRATR